MCCRIWEQPVINRQDTAEDGAHGSCKYILTLALKDTNVIVIHLRDSIQISTAPSVSNQTEFFKRCSGLNCPY